MRINVYSQEITSEVQQIVKHGTNAEGEEETFFGIRLYLHSSERLHHTPDDDDRSAITFWLPKSNENRLMVAKAFEYIADEIHQLIWEQSEYKTTYSGGKLTHE